TEFPLHCPPGSCWKLDFLPLKCDARNEAFCKDHFMYSLHQCASAYKKDVQVPICPLCNSPSQCAEGKLPVFRTTREHISVVCCSRPPRCTHTHTRCLEARKHLCK
uniref:AN1-type domain-containing protein n=1 Tax=Salvator merianae TaxID=96440 RepID=A0A8D0CAV2_SALMN